MAYSYKGSISFGLVYIPITLHNTIKDNSIGFNMIDKKTMSRVKYKKTCSACDGREVKQEDIVKGYEYEEGKYVIFEDKDFEKIKSKKDKNITIEKFVDVSDVDPLYFDKPYYVVPTGAEKAYSVLLTAMEEENKAAIAKTVLGEKETLIMIRAKNGQMLLNTLFFEEEVQKNPSKEIKDSGNTQELKMAKAIIESMSGEFKPEEYKIEEKGKAFFELAKKENLEGIVAKKKDGLYHIGKRTRDWVKIKVMQDEDLIVLGYKPDAKGNVKDLILGYEENGKLKCKGSVYLGISKEERDYIKKYATKNKGKAIDGKYKDVIWVKPKLIGTVQYMQETESGNMRQPVWKGLKMD